MRRPLLDCRLVIVGGKYLLFCSDLWGVVANKYYMYIAVYGSKLCFEEKKIRPLEIISPHGQSYVLNVMLVVCYSCSALVQLHVYLQ